MLWPERDGDLATIMQRLTGTQVTQVAGVGKQVAIRGRIGSAAALSQARPALGLASWVEATAKELNPESMLRPLAARKEPRPLTFNGPVPW